MTLSIAKLKLSNELECGDIYGMTYDTYIDINIAGDASVGLAQARPNYTCAFEYN